MVLPKLVLYTNVLIAGLKSQLGASYKLLSSIDKGLFQVAVSVPLVFEYEAVAKRHSLLLGLTYNDIDDIIDFICKIADRRSVFYFWRPQLLDPADEMILELAVTAKCDAIVTHNVKHFIGISHKFEIETWTPQQALSHTPGITHEFN
ncbi:MAG: PIN domain-containing protein [Pirellulales bacterium]|nr:PIN domain-containing protein [Pirellulales bacterium]